MQLPPQLREHRDGHVRRRLQRRLQGQVALQQARRSHARSRPDLDQYGFARWNPPDAGANQGLDQIGGGIARQRRPLHDDDGRPGAARKAPLPYLTSVAAAQQPFFMIISLVNPHDVLVYPNNFAGGGLRRFVAGRRHRPAGHGRRGPLDKPPAQAAFLKIFNLSRQARHPAEEAQLPQLLRQPDEGVGQLPGEVLDALESTGLLDDTLVIRTADHGEMGLTHGGHAPEELQLLRGVHPHSARLLQPEAVHEAANARMRWSPTWISCPRSRASSPRRGRARATGRASTTRADASEPRRRQSRTTSSSPTTTSRPARRAVPIPAAAITSPASARRGGSSPGTTTPTARSRPSGRCTTSRPIPWRPRTLPSPGYRRTPAENAQYVRLRRRLAKVRATRLQPL